MMNIKKIAIIIGVILSLLFVVATIWTIMYPTYNATITYATEAVPAVEAVEAKEAVYETSTVEMTYEKPAGYPENDGEDAIQYECGTEIPLGEVHYKADFETNTNYINVWDQNGDLVETNFEDLIWIAGGELNDIDEDTFTCKEGYTVDVWWDSVGSITFTTEELIEEAIPAVPAQPAIPSEEITEKLSYDSGTGTWIATSNGESVEPTELKEYEKLKTDIENQMN